MNWIAIKGEMNSNVLQYIGKHIILAGFYVDFGLYFIGGKGLQHSSSRGTEEMSSLTFSLPALIDAVEE